MKKLLIGAALLLTSAFSAWSQGGLDSVIVERYYYSTLADSLGSDAAGGGALPVGSSTFRIYVDLKPGFKFQALYGTEDASKMPLHTLLITSTAPFYNEEDRGDVVPDGFTNTSPSFYLTNNTLMLDSWFSVGAAAAGKFGVHKSEDPDGSLGNLDGLLANNTGWAEAITGPGSKDGLMSGNPQSVTFVGLSGELNVFDNSSLLNDTFKTTNGSIAALNGAVGPTSTNRILVGQFTTKGTFCWELNIQIKDTVNNVVQNYVAQNPTGAELTHPSLMGCDSAGKLTQVQEHVNSPIGLSINAYPNPVVDACMVEINATELNNEGSIMIYNVLGNAILQKDLGSVKDRRIERIDMSSFPPGIYVVEVSSSNGYSSHRQIIKK